MLGAIGIKYLKRLPINGLNKVVYFSSTIGLIQCLIINKPFNDEYFKYNKRGYQVRDTIIKIIRLLIRAR